MRDPHNIHQSSAVSDDKCEGGTTFYHTQTWLKPLHGNPAM